MQPHILLLIFLTFSSSILAQTAATLQHAGETREYLYYLPSSYDESQQYPLMITFHGGAGTMEDQTYLFSTELAEQENFIVVYPQALPDPNDGNSTVWSLVNSGTLPYTFENPHDDIGFVSELIDEMVANHSVDIERVYACGFSNGGGFSFDISCRLSEKIAAVGVVARSMYVETHDECNYTHPMPTITINGTDDFYEGITYEGVLYFLGYNSLNEFLASSVNASLEPTITPMPDLDSSDGSTVELQQWDGGDNCISIEHYKVINGGHSWPGSYWSNQDIDASQVIWDYVSQYNLNGLIDCSSNVEDQSIETLTIYPNPATNQTTFSWDSSLGSQALQIYDLSGRVVANINKIQNSTLIKLDLESGVYIVVCEEFTSKLVIK